MIEPPDYGTHTLRLTGQLISQAEHLYRFALLEDERVPHGRIPDLTFAMITGSSDIFFVIYGFIKYRDVFGKAHTTAFGRQYSALARSIGAEQFQVYGSEAYNYTS